MPMPIGILVVAVAVWALIKGVPALIDYFSRHGDGTD